MNYFTLVLEQVILFAIYACVGVIAVKGGILNRDSLSALAKLITRVALPLLIFTNTLNGSNRMQLLAALPVLGVVAALYLLLFSLALLLKKLFRLKEDRGRIYWACTMFGNVGFMGIPIIMALFPVRGMLYIALFSIVDQLSFWTIGVKLTTPGSEEDQSSVRKQLMKLINPAMVGILLAILGVLTGLHLPELLHTALHTVGSTATPLSLIYLGGMFCFVPIREGLLQKEFYGTVIVKMLALPVLLWLVLRHIPWISRDFAMVICLLTATPSMSSVAMLAQSQESEAEYGVEMVFVTTLCSAVTIPAVCFLISG